MTPVAQTVARAGRSGLMARRRRGAAEGKASR
jgi:hypothetical protein